MNEKDIIIDKNEDINNDSKNSYDNVIDLKEINRFVEEKVIEMLSNQGMTKTEIAKKLGISRTALWKKTKA